MAQGNLGHKLLRTSFIARVAFVILKPGSTLGAATLLNASNLNASRQIAEERIERLAGALLSSGRLAANSEVTPNWDNVQISNHWPGTRKLAAILPFQRPGLTPASLAEDADLTI